MSISNPTPFFNEEGYLQLNELELPDGEIVNDSPIGPCFEEMEAVAPLRTPDDEAPIMTLEQQKIETLVQEILSLRRQLATVEQRLQRLEKNSASDDPS